MTNNFIPDGCILLARKLQESDIWRKPADWLKIWVHILQEVNHKERKGFNRGENFFNLTDLARDCGVGYWTVVNCIQWLKRAKQITTRKTTRGVIIFVLEYDKYQDLESYKNKIENNTTDNTETRQKQDGTNTINKNEKNDKNEKKSSKAIRIETEVIYEEIDRLCQSHDLLNKVDLTALDIIVESYIGKVRMKPLIPHCIAWLVGEKVPAVTANHIGGWFKQEKTIQKREQLRQLEWKEEQINPAMAERRKARKEKELLSSYTSDALSPVSDAD